MKTRPAWSEVPPATVTQIEEKFSEPIASVLSLTGGYSPMGSYKIAFKSGRLIFSKMDHPGNTDKGHESFKAELLNYETFQQISKFAPQFLGQLQSGDRHFMFLEWRENDGSPPPWAKTTLSSVIQKILLLHNTPPADIFPNPPPFKFEFQKNWSSFFNANPSHKLKSHKDTLLELERRASNYEWSPVPIHLDLRSDNFIVSGTGNVTLIDWSYFTLGPRAVDLAFWLPSLVLEKGPSPEEVVVEYERLWGQTFMHDELIFAALTVCGFFALHGHQPAIASIPELRSFQMAQFNESFAWLERILSNRSS